VYLDSCLKAILNLRPFDHIEHIYAPRSTSSHMRATFHFYYSFIPFDLRPQWNLCYTSVWRTFEFLLSNISSILNSNIFFILY
jgi:hypothetical protein